ncbi:hypothetical protein LAUMK142_05813 [Mycobacterium pseudokansasii]|uniref:Uncharacterized protein n=1 Tax=Mycobacterium pseudokansasii TaxID=2341080 RepID=A0A498R0C2_9MYCO|nr:hypothetical protein LAUMK142_05813 [Mycobacterium pseudokansasii]
MRSEKFPVLWAIALGLARSDQSVRVEIREGLANVSNNRLLPEFVNRTGVAVGTWRSRATGWYGGPVHAAWPTREKLGEIADDPRTRALCVVPWGNGEVDAWAAAAQPKLLGPAVRLEPSSGLDPIVVEGLKTLTHSVNMANDLAGSLDRRDAVAVLRTSQRRRLPASGRLGLLLGNRQRVGRTGVLSGSVPSQPISRQASARGCRAGTHCVPTSSMSGVRKHRRHDPCITRPVGRGTCIRPYNTGLAWLWP